MIALDKDALIAYKDQTRSSLSPRTLCFLIREGQVLLGKKKKGFGEGKWLGIGGKIESDETIKEATIREVQEEIGVTPAVMHQVGVFNFYFPTMPEPAKWNQQANVYVSTLWSGEVTETDEMKPSWFTFAEVPYSGMWPDAAYWLPDILSGETLFGEFVFDEQLKVLDVQLQEQMYE